MQYIDHKNGFLIKLPDSWKTKRRNLWFLSTGGKVAFESYNRQTTLNISVGKLDRPQWANPIGRKKAMSEFLRGTPGADYIEEIEIQLDGEENTVAYRYAGMPGFSRIISSYHEGIEYVIQSHDGRTNSNELVIDKIIGSFQFVSRTQESPSSTNFAAMNEQIVTIVFVIAAFITFRLVYGAWPPFHGSLEWPKALWAILAGIGGGMISSLVIRVILGE